MSSIQETNLKAIADAIRAKNGTTDPIQASTFPDLIAAISTGMRPRLIVQTVAGATVTATKGEHRYSGTANDKGLCHFELPASDSQGEWAVTSSLNDTTVSSTINIGTQTLIMDAITDPVFSNNDWSAIIAACQSGNVPSTWAVGDSKTMAINNTEYQIDIIGKNHDDYADGSGKAPLTFQLHDCYGTAYAMNSDNFNTGGWKDCAMRMSILPSILELMPEEVQNAIRGISKKASAGNLSSTIETVSDTLFLLADVEVFGTLKYGYKGEGSQYTYYVNGGSKNKLRNGKPGYWLLRSPDNSDRKFFCAVGGSGDQTDYPAGGVAGVSFAFCF